MSTNSSLGCVPERMLEPRISRRAAPLLGNLSSTLEDSASDQPMILDGVAVTRHSSVSLADHSIIRSIRRRTEGGMLIPRIVAILRFTTSSKRVGCSTGSSPGFAPLRTRST